ncbi:MAG: hypothetical protein LBE06_03745 [Azoarcus sp.]|nr:hypothetical protein [Azoarcus sp.]
MAPVDFLLVEFLARLAYEMGGMFLLRGSPGGGWRLPGVRGRRAHGEHCDRGQAHGGYPEFSSRRA